MLKPSLLIAAVFVAMSMPVFAQQTATPAPIQRTILQKLDVPGSTTHETTTGHR